LPWEKGQKFCNVCGGILVVSKVEGHGDFYFCQKCKDWKYPNHYKTHKYKFKKTSKADRMTTTEMRHKMDEYIDRTKLISRVKTYTTENYSQDFLKSLIPKD
jgi:DNA-directed RNA polymerase subunit M/transcription elongation factor TFIIS